MRCFPFAAVSAVALLVAAGSTSAVAQDYPWCLQGKDWGYPGQCQFWTYNLLGNRIRHYLILWDQPARRLCAPAARLLAGGSGTEVLPMTSLAAKVQQLVGERCGAPGARGGVALKQG